MQEFDVLIGPGPTIEQVVKCLEEIVGHPFVKQEVEWDLYETYTMGVGLRIFHADDFDNVPGIEFDRFCYLLVIDALNITRHNSYNEAWHRFVALFLGSMLSEELEIKCMVVANLTTVIENFPILAE